VYWLRFGDFFLFAQWPDSETFAYRGPAQHLSNLHIHRIFPGDGGVVA
jgi:hypothetical protein